ncbi:MAG TPA: prephenate dehydratase [Terriglobia bacterium]|jgi:prephenate dehydratase
MTTGPLPYDAAYQGTRGSNSEDACIDLLSASAKLLPRTTLEDVFKAVTRGEARYGVVPIENTLAGTIHACYDLLFEHDLKIVGETVRHILFQLIAPPGVGLEDLRRALSHPKALEQCEKFFRQHPQIQPVPEYDTAGAVEIVIKQARPDAAAIATRRAADVYGGVILAEAIQDHLENYTRFLLITPSESQAPPVTSGNDYKTTIVFGVGNAPGALYHSLRPFAERRIDLTKIESRPLRGSPFEYVFYLDLIGRPDSTAIVDALGELRSQAKTVRVLGTYPRYKG